MLYIDPRSQSPALRGAEAINRPAREKEILQEFERIFIKQLLNEMRKTLPEGGLFAKSQQQRHFEDLFDDHLAGEMSRSGQFGIAARMGEQLARASEAKNAALSRDTPSGLPLTPERDGLAIRAAAAGIDLRDPREGPRLRPSATGLPFE